jgi:hypothetical protein
MAEAKSPGRAACEAFWAHLGTGPDGQPSSAAWDWARSQGTQDAWMAASQAAIKAARAGRPWPLPPAPVKLACFFCDGETYNPDGICGRCRKDGKSYDGIGTARETTEDGDG